ncbi:sensor histidine kinase [Microvirga rosea]|uniref:sensor histidine kinase n=1 Tax=Microvirga rosea TaxID=2715425 RepID=UPI001D0B4BAE|nr:PAS domain-containing sensor histidine kinase [Microvirga rosea]MCB8822497.1 PAS domain-containing sensor histidine kinase [Microvirga rosea]
MKAHPAKVDTANERLRSILAIVNDCYFALDQRYRITDLNQSAIDWVGPTQSRVLGACLWDLCDPGAECSRVIREGMEQRRRVRREVMSGLRPGRWIDLQVSPSADGLSVFITDITERRSAKEALEELSGRLLNLQEEERQRIAEELHDSTAQHLVAAGLNLMRMKQYVSPGDGGKLLNETADLVEEAARELRAFTYLLHPPSLENGGLAGTVRDFAAGFTHRTGLSTTVQVPEMANHLPFDIQRSLLRVIQEALTNAYRHASASRLVVDLRTGRGILKLRILDDGCGLAQAVRKMAPGGPLLGVGVAGMRARLVRFGGDLKFLSDGRGTMVIATLPHASSSPA